MSKVLNWNLHPHGVRKEVGGNAKVVYKDDAIDYNLQSQQYDDGKFFSN